MTVRNLIVAAIRTSGQRQVTNRGILAQAGAGLTIHAVRRVTRDMVARRQLAVVERRAGRVEVYGAGRYFAKA